MKRCAATLLILLICLQSCNISGTSAESSMAPTGKNNVAYKWGKVAMECTANDTERFNPRPTVTSRFLALTWTAVFDAWSRYDDSATPLYLASVDRRPVEERTMRNKEIAISYAAYRAMREYYFSDSLLLREKMVSFGLDPDDHSLDPRSPAIGSSQLRLEVKEVVDLQSNLTDEQKALAGMSRVIGGYHIQSDNLEGLALGRKVAGAVWKKYLYHTGSTQTANLTKAGN